MRVRISTASGSERDPTSSALATARGTDPARFPVHAIANLSRLVVDLKDPTPLQITQTTEASSCCGVFYPDATTVNVAGQTLTAIIIVPARLDRLDGVASRVRAEIPTGFANNEIHKSAAISPARFTGPGLRRVRMPILRPGQ